MTVTADFSSLRANRTSGSLWDPGQAESKRESLVPSLQEWYRHFGKGFESKMGLPLRRGCSVTVQDPSSTSTVLSQNLGHLPRMALSPPTAWLQSQVLRDSRPPSLPPRSHFPCPPFLCPFSLNSLPSWSSGDMFALVSHFLTGRIGMLCHPAP